MFHQLKIEPGYFESVTNGTKTFEIRKNDRNFKVGDFLALNEIDQSGKETGRCCLVYVTYLLSDMLETFLQKDYVAMSITACSVTKRQDDPLCSYRTGVPIYWR